MIEEVTGLKMLDAAIENPAVPNIRVSGSLDNHYAPKAKVFLDQEPSKGSGFIALADIETPQGVIRLASPRSVEEFAQILYSALREADHMSLDSIYVTQPTGDGLGEAIRDRLSRSKMGRSG
jgi:L-threonylcarbamoyladenylate synthase